MIDAWNEVARSSGLRLVHVFENRVPGATFSALRREMAHATAPVSSFATSPWLTGARRDVAVVVRPLVLTQVGNAKPPAPNAVCAIAEIDPPLLAGIRLVSRSLIPFFGAPANAEMIEHPSLDTQFAATAFDMMRVRELLLPGGMPDRLGESIAEAGSTCMLVIRDSTVEAISLSAMPDANRIEWLLDVSTMLAREISARVPNLRHSPLEISAREAWQKVAAKLGLSVDPLRWHIFGTLGGVEVSAMLDGSPPAVSTTFRARFRARLACRLLLRRDFRGHGVRPGYEDLDNLFSLEAHDLGKARGLLDDRELRRRIAAEAETSNLVLDDREIVTGRGGFASPREIAQRLEALVAIVDRMTPPVPAAGPFR